MGERSLGKDGGGGATAYTGGLSNTLGTQGGAFDRG